MGDGFIVTELKESGADEFTTVVGMNAFNCVVTCGIVFVGDGFEIREQAFGPIGGLGLGFHGVKPGIARVVVDAEEEIYEPSYGRFEWARNIHEDALALVCGNVRTWSGMGKFAGVSKLAKVT